MKTSSAHHPKRTKIHLGKKSYGGASGAVVGAVVGGPIGAVIGGLLGTAFGAAAEYKPHPAVKAHTARRAHLKHAVAHAAKRVRRTAAKARRGVAHAHATAK